MNESSNVVSMSQARWEALCKNWPSVVDAETGSMSGEQLLGWVMEGVGLAREMYASAELDIISGEDESTENPKELRHVALTFLWIMERAGFSVNRSDGDIELEGG